MQKITITKDQLADLELLVVGYMHAAKNEEGLCETAQRFVLDGLDKIWDNKFDIQE